MKQVFTVQPISTGAMRIDVWLASVSDLSRSRIKSLIKTGRVSCEGMIVRTTSQGVREGEVYCVTLPSAETTEPVPQAMPLDILFEDEAIIVLSKPPDLVVHPAAGHANGTLVNALLAHCPELKTVGDEQRPGIVHRLDQDTSGVMVVAKTDAAMTALGDAFRAGLVHKTYLAIVHGVPEPSEGRLETLMGRHPTKRHRMAVRYEEGRRAVTTYAVAETFRTTSLLHVEIETGRTHQIRVHMHHIGCPIVGDATYGSRKRDAALPRPPSRQMLHAWRLAFPHPSSGREMKFEAPPPVDFTAMLEALRLEG
ncbi:MAG: RluA family pseudouridine synthase [Kiritimatiellia bacterium]|jgi:23S rRNA pseudouridine1911/1915/1917 synthase